MNAPDHVGGTRAFHQHARFRGVDFPCRERAGGHAREIRAVGDLVVEAPALIRAERRARQALQRFVELRVRLAQGFDLGNGEHWVITDRLIVGRGVERDTTAGHPSDCAICPALREVQIATRSVMKIVDENFRRESSQLFSRWYAITPHHGTRQGKSWQAADRCPVLVRGGNVERARPERKKTEAHEHRRAESAAQYFELWRP